MKAKLEFELPEDEDAFNVASKAMDWALIAWDIEQQCRDWVKYDNHQFKSIEEALQGVRDIINEAMAEKGVRFPS
jgi:transcriptional accessory protein Tex/SPT6